MLGLRPQCLVQAADRLGQKIEFRPVPGVALMELSTEISINWPVIGPERMLVTGTLLLVVENAPYLGYF